MSQKGKKKIKHLYINVATMYSALGQVEVTGDVFRHQQKQTIMMIRYKDICDDVKDYLKVNSPCD